MIHLTIFSLFYPSHEMSPSPCVLISIELILNESQHVLPSKFIYCLIYSTCVLTQKLAALNFIHLNISQRFSLSLNFQVKHLVTNMILVYQNIIRYVQIIYSYTIVIFGKDIYCDLQCTIIVSIWAAVHIKKDKVFIFCKGNPCRDIICTLSGPLMLK